MTTFQDFKHQVANSLGDWWDEFDVDSVARSLWTDGYQDVDDVDESYFWDLVSQYDTYVGPNEKLATGYEDGDDQRDRAEEQYVGRLMHSED